MSDDIITATGRRKTAVARVQVKPGSGSITVNDSPFDEYFPTVALPKLMPKYRQISKESAIFPLPLKSLSPPECCLAFRVASSIFISSGVMCAKTSCSICKTSF